MTRSSSTEFPCASPAEALQERRRPRTPPCCYVTMSPMKEKPMSTKRAKQAPAEEQEREAREPGRDDPQRNQDRPERPETEKRARELAERHRETLDYLSKN